MKRARAYLCRKRLGQDTVGKLCLLALTAFEQTKANLANACCKMWRFIDSGLHRFRLGCAAVLNNMQRCLY